MSESQHYYVQLVYAQLITESTTHTQGEKRFRSSLPAWGGGNEGTTIVNGTDRQLGAYISDVLFHLFR